MSNIDRIDELVEEILESGRTPEDVCQAHPDLLADVQARLRKLRAIEAQVDSLFPPSQGHAKTILHAPLVAEVAFPSVPDYDVHAVLGRGGMGIVYKARHRKLNRDVALKMLLTGSFASRQEHLRFVREAESVAALRHPNIVQIYELGEVDGHPFYTMEYVRGGSLAERLAGMPQPARESATMVSALARAVDAAHQAGIVHRDLKPANVMLAEADAPKITDFGLARRLDRESELTHTGARIGTPSYMAPEQMLGSPSALGPGVDVFALGAILYEMLTGRPPFRGDSLSDTERRLASEDPAPPTRFNPKIPRDLETICLKCLEKEPRGRYASAGALADDLDRFLRHEPIQARPIAPAERWVRWVRRNPLPAALAVTSLVLVALIASQTTQSWTEAAASRAEKARLTSRFNSGVQLVQEGRFAEARAILGKLGDGGFTDLRTRIDRALSDLRLVEQLEAIEVKRVMALATGDPSWLPAARAAQEYESLFERAKIGTPDDDPLATAQRIRAADIQDPLIAALDDWAVCESCRSRRDWVLDVAQRASSGTDDKWEDQCRDPATWDDPAALERLAESAPIATASVQQLRALGDRLAAAGLNATPFRSRVQQEHVDSFLANLALADDLRPTNPAEAVRYYQAALAIHPRSATAHNNLAVALANLGRTAEAATQFERSLKLDPNSAAPHYNLGLVFSSDQPAEAARELREAVRLAPSLVSAHRKLGELLLAQQQYADAARELQACLTSAIDERERAEIQSLLDRCQAPPGTPGD